MSIRRSWPPAGARQSRPIAASFPMGGYVDLQIDPIGLRTQSIVHSSRTSGRRLSEWDMTSTRLTLLLLAIASFAPVAMSLQPGWWAAIYYGALFVWWVLLSMAIVSWTTPDDRRTDRSVGASGHRLVVVARGQAVLHACIRAVLLGDEAAKVVLDRRNVERRRQFEVFIPDRRRAERRRYNVQPLLMGQGWAEVRLLETHADRSLSDLLSSVSPRGDS
jgi:hypothetical protein